MKSARIALKINSDNLLLSEAVLNTLEQSIGLPSIHKFTGWYANSRQTTPLSEEESQEAEIALLRKRYFQLLADESNLDTTENRLRAENEKLKQDISFMQKRYEDRGKELETVHQKYDELLREFGGWEGVLTKLKDDLKIQEGNQNRLSGSIEHFKLARTRLGRLKG
jgi:chromosome segregation ATPase